MLPHKTATAILHLLISTYVADGHKKLSISKTCNALATLKLVLNRNVTHITACVKTRSHDATKFCNFNRFPLIICSPRDYCSFSQFFACMLVDEVLSHWRLKWDSFHCVGHRLYYTSSQVSSDKLSYSKPRDVLIPSSSSKILVVVIIETPEDFNDPIRFLANWESFPIPICVNTRSCLMRVIQFNKKDSMGQW